MTAPALTLEGVDVHYPGGGWAVRDVSLEVESGERVALVGESGCGKTTIVRACLGLLPAGAIVGGSIRIAGTEVVDAPPRALRRLRGRAIGYVPQDPRSAFDPLRPVRHHLTEAWRAHHLTLPSDIAERLRAVGVKPEHANGRGYPHTWSGGMLQRACAAAATAHDPPLVIADEPTSALDSELADRVLDAVAGRSQSLLLVTHDLRLVGRHVDTIAVCYAGRIVERGPAAATIDSPRHPYTACLLAALPQPGAGRPTPTPGNPPPADAPDVGCPFAPRCGRADDRCHDRRPPLERSLACWHPLS